MGGYGGMGGYGSGMYGIGNGMSSTADTNLDFRVFKGFYGLSGPMTLMSRLEQSIQSIGRLSAHIQFSFQALHMSFMYETFRMCFCKIRKRLWVLVIRLNCSPNAVFVHAGHCSKFFKHH